MEAEEETQTSRLEDIKYYTSLLLGQEHEYSRIFFYHFPSQELSPLCPSLPSSSSSPSCWTPPSPP